MKRSQQASIPKVVLTLLATFQGIAFAQAPITPEPGEYITAEGWGVLTITHPVGPSAHFSLRATGANGHMCGLEGEILEDRATIQVDPPVPGDGPPRSCVVLFETDAEGIEVSSVVQGEDFDDPCMAFCGMRASFQGEYLTPAPGCTGAERAETRASFQRLYDAKSYAEAEAVLEPLLDRCGKTLGEEGGWIANDLAITQYHLGRLADCRQTLGPLLEDAAHTDADLRASLPPFNFQQHLPLVQATRHNLKLCTEDH